jgi:hypothetical protein
MIDPLQVDAIAHPPTWQAVLDFVMSLSRTEAVYDPDGWPRIKEDIGSIDSGLAVTCDPDFPTRLRIPWERPIEREITNPEFATYAYWITYVQETGTPFTLPKLNIPVFGQQAGTPQIGGVPISGVFSQPVVKLEFIAMAISNAVNNPYIAGFSKERADTVKGQYSFNIADQTAQQYVNGVLHKALAAADRVHFPCDNLFPASDYLKQNIRIELDDEGITGWFKLVEIDQPLNQNPSTLVLDWDAD